MPTNLKQAQADPRIMEQFVAEHKGDQIESDDFDRVLGSMTPARGKSAKPKPRGNKF